MRIIIMSLLLLSVTTMSYATATSETGDRCKPCTLYGKNASGEVKVILTDTNGIVQVTTNN